MDDTLKGKFFRDLIGLDLFQAQSALEEETYNSYLRSLLTMNLSSEEKNVVIEMARLRGALDAINALKIARERCIDLARSRDKNS